MWLAYKQMLPAMQQTGVSVQIPQTRRRQDMYFMVKRYYLGISTCEPRDMPVLQFDGDRFRMSPRNEAAWELSLEQTVGSVVVSKVDSLTTSY